MNKDLKLIHNFIQFVFYNYSMFHYLKPPRKGVIEKMTHLAEFWLILENDLVERARHKMLDELI
jgi:hypothetical protein